ARRSWATAVRGSRNPRAIWRMRLGSGSSPGSGPAIRAAALLDPAAIADQAVQPPRLDVGAELGRLADHRFAGAEHQPAVLGHRPGEPLEGERFLVRAQVEQHVAAQHDVEPAGVRRRLEQVVDLVAHRLAQRLDRPPAVGTLLEPFDHLVDAEAALDLELGVAAAPRAVDAGVRHVGPEDIDGPSDPLLGLLGEQHRERIDFLAGRAARGPDPDPAILLPPHVQLGQGIARQQIERRAVAEEIGFVVQQGLHDLLGQARFAAHDEDGDQLVEGRDSALPEQSRKRGLDPPPAAHCQLLAGPRLEQPGQDSTTTVADLHAYGPSVREAIRRASLSGGKAAQASPASSTARGMPHTAQLASSWARTEPPLATSRAAPSTPSRPIPVRITPTARAP